MFTMLGQAQLIDTSPWASTQGRTALNGVSLTTVEHPRVANDETRRVVVVGAGQPEALETTFDVHVTVGQRTEHHPVQGRDGLFLQHFRHRHSLRRALRSPRAEWRAPGRPMALKVRRAAGLSAREAHRRLVTFGPTRSSPRRRPAAFAMS